MIVFLRLISSCSHNPCQSLVVELFRLLVKRNTLSSTVDGAESGDSELLPCLRKRCHPWALFQPFSVLVLLLGHDPAVFVKHQIRLHQTALGEFGGAVPDLAHGSGLHLSCDALRFLHLGATDSTLCCF